MSKWQVRKLIVFIVQVKRLVLNLKSLTINIVKISKVFIFTFLSAVVTSKLVENTAHSRIASTCIDVTQLEPNAFTDIHDILNEGSLTKDKLSLILNPIQDDGHLFQKVD